MKVYYNIIPYIYMQDAYITVAARAAAVADPKIVSERSAAYTMTRAKSIITQ